MERASAARRNDCEILFNRFLSDHESMLAEVIKAGDYYKSKYECQQYHKNFLKLARARPLYDPTLYITTQEEADRYFKNRLGEPTKNFKVVRVKPI